ncbi:MAG TPA: alpha/beta hydrolase [Campylobacterales bacterium]|nr:alpha/beta hydrolase [Campylobacterales bacterium]
MKLSFLFLLLFLFVGCSSKIPNTWNERVKKAPTSDIKLQAYVQGEGEPLLLLHGFGSSSYSFHHLVEPLSKKFRVYNLDLKGFGDSPKPKDFRYSVYDQAVLVSKFIHDNSLENITLIGHSYGGGVALSLVLINQSNIDKMVLIDPAAYKQYIPSLIRRIQIPIIGPAVFYLLSSSYEVKESYQYAFYDKQKIEQTTIDIMANNLNKDNAKQVYIYAIDDLIPEDIDEVSKRYHQIKIPTLIIWGEKDVVIRKSKGYRLKRDLQNAELKIIKNCGHIPHEEKPKEVLKYLLEFL